VARGKENKMSKRILVKKNFSCKKYVLRKLPTAKAVNEDGGWSIYDGNKKIGMGRASWYAWYSAWYRLAHCTP
jgi:hypothetical protein